METMQSSSSSSSSGEQDRRDVVLTIPVATSAVSVVSAVSTFSADTFEVVRHVEKYGQPIFIKSKKSAAQVAAAAADGDSTTLEDDKKLLPISVSPDHFVRSCPLNHESGNDMVDETYWNEPQDFVCFYDDEPYHGIPIPIPISYSYREKYKAQFCYRFCSPTCMLTYVATSNEFHYPDIAPRAQIMMMERFGIRHILSVGAPKTCLQKHFGPGGLTIEEFRSERCRQLLNVQVLAPPVYIAPAYMVVKPKAGHPDYQSVVALEANIHKQQDRNHHTPANQVRFIRPTESLSLSSSSSVDDAAAAAAAPIVVCDPTEATEATEATQHAIEPMSLCDYFPVVNQPLTMLKRKNAEPVDATLASEPLYVPPAPSEIIESITIAPPPSKRRPRPSKAKQ
jgi:hypothetical protein